MKREMGKGKKETEISYWYTRKAGNQKTEKKKSRKSFRCFLPSSKSRAKRTSKSLLSAKEQSKPWFQKPNGKMGEEPLINKKNKLQIECKTRLAEA